MIRASKLNGTWYAIEFEKLNEEEVENIVSLIEEGTAVVIGETLESIKYVIEDEIVVVKDEN